MLKFKDYCTYFDFWRDTMKKKFVGPTVTLLLSLSAYSECLITTTRIACPHMEARSYRKCDGNPSCSKRKRASDQKSCQEAGLKECANSHFDLTKSKNVTATWKGQTILSPGGHEDFCTEYANRTSEFNQCKE